MTDTNSLSSSSWKNKTLEKIRVNVGQPELAFVDCPKNRIDTSIETRMALSKCSQCKYHRGIKGYKIYKTPSYNYPRGHVVCEFREMLIRAAAGQVAAHIKANKSLSLWEWEDMTAVRAFDEQEQLEFRNFVYDCLSEKFPELMQYATDLRKSQ